MVSRGGSRGDRRDLDRRCWISVSRGGRSDDARRPERRRGGGVGRGRDAHQTGVRARLGGVAGDGGGDAAPREGGEHTSPAAREKRPEVGALHRRRPGGRAALGPRRGRRRAHDARRHPRSSEGFNPRADERRAAPRRSALSPREEIDGLQPSPLSSCQRKRGRSDEDRSDHSTRCAPKKGTSLSLKKGDYPLDHHTRRHMSQFHRTVPTLTLHLDDRAGVGGGGVGSDLSRGIRRVHRPRNFSRERSS